MPDPTTDVTTTQALAAAKATVDRFASGAPDAIKLVATNRLATWYQRFPADGSTNIGFSDQSVATMQAGAVDALRGSGAAGLLAAWRRPRSRKVTADD